MPGAVKQINSPFGNRPQDLPTQVPNVGIGSELADKNAQMSQALPDEAQPAPAQTPGAPAAAAQPQQGGGSSIDAELDSLFAEMDGTSLDNTNEFAPEPGFIQANIQQFRDAGTRFATGLAANDNEVMGFLKKKYGEENVKWKDGKAFFRNKGEKQFRPLDPAAFELFADLIPDFSRGFVEEAAALPAELGGGAIAGPGGAYAGRVASAPAQVAIADYVAEKAGVPQDPSRSKVMEMGVQTAMEAALPIIGKRLAKLIPGTEAYKMAKEAGERELTALSKQSQAVAHSVNELEQMGKAVKVDGQLVGVPGAEINLGAHHLNPESAKIRSMQNQAQENPQFVNAMRKHAEEWGDLFEKTMKEISSQNAKGNKISPELLSKNVVNAVADVRRIEGENIGKYKLQALRKLGDKPQPIIDEVMQPLSQMVQIMEFTPSGAPVKPEQLQKLVGKYGITSIGEARAIANNINDVMFSIQKDGGLNIKDMDRFRNSIGDLSERMRGTPAGRQLGALASAFRENYKRTISSGIDNEFEQLGFRTAMDDYTGIMGNIDVLRHALDEDSSAQAIVSKFFTGRDNIEKLKSIKSLSPESFDSLRAEWINQQMNKFRSRDVPTGIAAGQFLDKVEKQYGPEFMNMVFPKQEQKTITNFLTVMERLNKTFGEGKVDTASEKLKQGAVNSLIGLVGDMKGRWMTGLAGMLRGRSGAEHAAVKLLTQGGIDKYVANYPGKQVDKKALSQKLKNFVAAYRVNKIVDSPFTTVPVRAMSRQKGAADVNAVLSPMGNPGE